MPEIGHTRVYRGQTYVVTETFERERARGGTAVILRWRSACPECGTVFTITTPAASDKFEPTRRCKQHRKPGVRVKEVRQ